MTSFPLRLLICLPLLAAFSFFVLMVPVWLDWEGEVEKSQQAALQVSATAVARMLAEDDRYLQFLEDEVAEVIYRLVPLTGPVKLDGRRDDWPPLEPVQLGIDHLLEVNEPYAVSSLVGRLAIGADSQFLYLHVSVDDDTVVYRELGSISVHRNDHIQIAVVDHDGVYRRFTVSVFQPGQVSVSELSASGRALRDVAAISGRWLATESGYNIELQMPRQMAKRRFSVVIGDVDDPISRAVRHVVGLSSTRAVEALGTVIYSPTELERVLQLLPYEISLQSQGGVNIASDGFETEPEKTVAVVSASAPIRRGDFESGRVVLQQPIAPSALLVGVLRQQTIVIFLLTLGIVSAATFALWILLRRRLAYLQDHLRDHVDNQSLTPLDIDAGDPLAAFALTLSEQMKRTHEHNDYLEKMAARLNHELRTPVSVVKSSLENLQSQSLDDSQSVYIDRAIQGVGRLTNILNKMSEARRLEEALDEDEVVPFDLLAVVSGCVAGYEGAFSAFRFELIAEVDEAPVTGIPELLAQLLDKLIDNAIEFSTGSVIKLRLHQEGNEVLLRVLNEGPELPPASAENLFSSMVSVRDEAAETHLGLGLYIARTVARFHGGDLGISNREDTRGVIVTLRLPLLRLTSKLAAARDSQARSF